MFLMETIPRLHHDQHGNLHTAIPPHGFVLPYSYASLFQQPIVQRTLADIRVFEGRHPQARAIHTHTDDTPFIDKNEQSLRHLLAECTGVGVHRHGSDGSAYQGQFSRMIDTTMYTVYLRDNKLAVIASARHIALFVPDTTIALFQCLSLYHGTLLEEMVT